ALGISPLVGRGNGLDMLAVLGDDEDAVVGIADTNNTHIYFITGVTEFWGPGTPNRKNRDLILQISRTVREVISTHNNNTASVSRQSPLLARYARYVFCRVLRFSDRPSFAPMHNSYIVVNTFVASHKHSIYILVNGFIWPDAQHSFAP